MKRDYTIFSNELACKIGMFEAVVLGKIYSWCKHNERYNKGYFDGFYWTSGTIKEYKERDFNYVSEDTVKRTFNKLKKLDLLVVEKSKESKKFGKSSNIYRVNLEEIKKQTGYEFDNLINEVELPTSRVDSTKEIELPTDDVDSMVELPTGVDSTLKGQSAPFKDVVKGNLHFLKGQSAPLKKGNLPPAIKNNNKNININNIYKQASKQANIYYQDYLNHLEITEAELKKDNKALSILAVIKNFLKSGENIRILGKYHSFYDVLEALYELDYNHIRYAVDRVEAEGRITHYNSFVMTILYYAKSEMDNFYTNIFKQSLEQNEYDYDITEGWVYDD